jgi:hypothetical protein
LNEVEKIRRTITFWAMKMEVNFGDIIVYVLTRKFIFAFPISHSPFKFQNTNSLLQLQKIVLSNTK